MKKFLILFLVSVSIYSQKYHGYVVTNSNDTIKCKFKVQTNLFNDDIYYPSSGTIITLNDSGEKTKYKPNQLKSYYLQGPNIKNYRFVSLKEDKNKAFYDEIQKGRICMYYHYKPNYGGGDPIRTIYVLKEGIFEKISGLATRKKFGEYIEDYPELYQRWMNSNKSFDIESMDYVVELYNKHFESLN
ncbi:hypothetical protein [Flavobacterium sp.]|uniref:hypothetical protein n=1 Tax=Flavobacterium sp. TaxID=239 RepID=UPI00286AFFC4|nr:hypothetical protein [Flavobacterium sp.]